MPEPNDPVVTPPGTADPPANAGDALAAGAVEVGVAASASASQAGEHMLEAVDMLAEKIRLGAATIDEAVASKPREIEAPVAPAPTFTPETLKALCDEKGLPEGTHDVFMEFAKNVIYPMYQGNITKQAKDAKREVLRDAKLGPAYTKHEAAIKVLMKEQGVNDAYIAEHGFERLVKLAAAEAGDFSVFPNAPASAAPVAPATPGATPPVVPAVAGPPAPPPPRPPVEGVAPITTAPVLNQPTTREEEIRAVEVTREEVDENRKIWGLSEGDLKTQRYEIAQWKKELGPIGLRQVGGVPVCSLDKLFGEGVVTK